MCCGHAAGPSARQLMTHCGSRGRLFDHLVGNGEHSQRDFEVERLCGLQVDDELKFCCLLNREVGRLGAVENGPDILDGDLAKRLCEVADDTVAHHAAA